MKQIDMRKRCFTPGFIGLTNKNSYIAKEGIYNLKISNNRHSNRIASLNRLTTAKVIKLSIKASLSLNRVIKRHKITGDLRSSFSLKVTLIL